MGWMEDMMSVFSEVIRNAYDYMYKLYSFLLGTMGVPEPLHPIIVPVLVLFTAIVVFAVMIVKLGWKVWLLATVFFLLIIFLIMVV